MPPPEPPDEPPRDAPLGGLLRNASPGGDLMAQQALTELQARLFGRPRDAIQIGRYVLEDRVGSGSSGVVYRAFDPKHERKVALKLLHAGEGRGYEAARARLLREAQALGTLDHPNVVRIFDVGTYDAAVLDPQARLRDPGVYLAMELLDGGTLERWLAEQPRGFEAVREAFLAAGRGLAAAHAQGIIHRDFKPANVSIDAEGRVRVLDFGLARPLGGLARPLGGLARPLGPELEELSMGMTAGAQQRLDALARPLDATLTAPGTLLGTPTYMAPEQHERQRATARSDQYAFCVALYEAWYEQRPFLATSEQELRLLKQRGAVLPPPEHVDVPPHCFAVLRRGLSPRPEDRFESMEALMQALATPAPRRPWTRGHWRTAAGLGVVLAAGLGAWALRDEPICEPATWSRAWSPSASAEAQAPATKAWVAAQLDALAEAGERLEAERCSRADAEPPEVTACATRQRERFAALVEAARVAEGPALVRVVEVLPRWPDPSSCAQATAGPAGELATLSADALLLRAQGRDADALPLARQALALARAQNDASLVADAAASFGHLALTQGQLDEAEAALTEALWSGEGATSDTARLLAAVDLLELARQASPRPTDAPLWIRLAREQATLPSVPDALRLRLHLGLAELALADGDPTRARTSLQHALELPPNDASTPWRHRIEEALAELERDG